MCRFYNDCGGCGATRDAGPVVQSVSAAAEARNATDASVVGRALSDAEHEISPPDSAPRRSHSHRRLSNGNGSGADPTDSLAHHSAFE